jgi:hypothetical protein
MKRKKPGKIPAAPTSAGGTRASASPAGAGSDPRVGLLTAAAASSAALVIAASFLPGARLWGINHLAFISPAARWIAITVLALAFIPAVARPAYRGLLRGAALAGGGGTNRRAQIAVLAVIGVAAAFGFGALRSSTLLLGDGQLIVRSFEAAAEGHDTVIMRSPRAIVNEDVIAPGTTLLYYAASKIATGPFKKTPLVGLQAFNCLLGGLFVFLLLVVATAGSVSPEHRTWLLWLGLFSCSIELFFGYVENYTAPFLLLFLYVVTAFRALHNRGPLWLPVVPLLLAVYGHVQSVLFVPSFVYLVIWKRASTRRGALLRLWTPLFACAAMIGVAAGSTIPVLKRFYVPFGFRNDQYALFAPHHLADIMNEVFLLLPIVPLVAAMLWVAHRAERAAGRNFMGDTKAARGEPTSWFSHPAEWQLAVTILIPCMFYLVLFHPEIGMARDWDLFTMTTLAIVPLVILTLNRYASATGAAADALARFAVPAFAVAAVTTTAWVGVNASANRTINRFERILSYDSTHASYAWENLALFYHDRGQLDKAIQTMRAASDQSHNPRQYTRLAAYLEQDGQMAIAIKILNDVLTRRPAYSKARFRLVMYLEKLGDWDQMLVVSKGGVDNNPTEGIYHFFYAESLRHAGRTEEAMAEFRACRNMNLPAAAKKFIDTMLRAYDQSNK